MLKRKAAVLIKKWNDLKDKKCLIGSPCENCEPSICTFYKHSYSRDNDQDEKEKENERTTKESED